METNYNPVLDDTPLSVFEELIARTKASPVSRVIPLHQGKTAFTTPVPLRAWDSNEFEYPPHHDGPTCGADSLLSAVRAKLSAQYGADVDPDRLSITNGITHGLNTVFHSVLGPGDEVVILSPHWLFAVGMVRMAGGVPVEVPACAARTGDPNPDSVELVRSRLSPRTRAVYFNTPNNPTGRVLPRAALAGLVALARERGLWLVSDNAYELYDFTPEGFTDPAALPGGAEVTFSAYSFSKSYGMTGYRIGYLVAPPALARLARKCGLYSIYSVSTVCQFAALAALRAGSDAVRANVRFVRTARDLTLSELRVPATRPDGGFYTLLDLAGWPAGVDDFIARCIDQGVSLAPGYAFGRGHDRFARLCYSVVPHDELAEGIRRVNEVYECGPGNRPRAN